MLFVAHSRRISNVANLIFLLLIIVYPKHSLSQNNYIGQSLEAQEARAIITQRIAEIAFPGPDRVSPVLAQFGYTPLAPPEIWRNFPAVHKFDAAYRGAEAARPGSGTQFLSEVIKNSQSTTTSSAMILNLNSLQTRTPRLQKLSAFRNQQPTHLLPSMQKFVE